MKNKQFLGIDWASRKGNKTFWLSLLAAGMIAVQAFLKPFGIEFDFAGVEANVADMINAIFGVLLVLGVVINPTTPGVTDSKDENKG